MKKVAIVDYGLANIRSVVNALNCFDVDITVAETGAELHGAQAIVLPGVGSFDAGMRGMRERGHEEALSRLVREKGVPFLGICLGLQFLFETSEEGEAAGLGWFPGRLRRFPTGPGKAKVPHIGWSDVAPQHNSIFRDLVPPFTFYFVHSYYMPLEDAQSITAATCSYSTPFAAAVEHENIAATQFHPEKSQLAGMKFLEGFLEHA